MLSDQALSNPYFHLTGVQQERGGRPGEIQATATAYQVRIFQHDLTIMVPIASFCIP